MKTHRNTAIIVGALFIYAIVTLFIGRAIYEPILNSTDYLNKVYPNKIIVLIGILIEFTGNTGLIFIPVLLYPIFKKHNEVLALGYVSFRLFESVLLNIALINKLSLINLSKNYLNKGGTDASCFQNIGSSILSVDNLMGASGLIYLIIFIIGGLIFYYVLYKSKLIPRVFSVWGIIADIDLLAGALFFSIVEFVNSPGMIIIALIVQVPIALNEIALSFRLIFKGFNLKAIASNNTK